MKYAVLLRGLNVGGLKLSMEQLRAIAQRAGFADPRTVLGSGNLLIQSEMPQEGVKAAMETALQACAGKPAHCLVRNEDELAALFRENNQEREGWHHYILFCQEPLLERLQALLDALPHEPDERLIGSGKDIHWWVPKGSTLGGFGTKVLGNKDWKDKLTSRNLRTVRKMAEVLKSLRPPG